MNQSVSDYWQEQYSINLLNHSKQNTDITKDFLKNSTNIIHEVLSNSQTLIEMGTGTGELSFELFSRFSNLNKVIGLDLSKEAIQYAKDNYEEAIVQDTGFRILLYKQYDFAKEPNLSKHFKSPDLIVCSNVLEHFKDPHTLLNKFLDFSGRVLIIVPYKQPCTDSYHGEGGAGHVFTFNDTSFLDYQIEDKFLFSSGGWQYSSNGETPLQFSVLLKKKLDIRKKGN